MPDKLGSMPRQIDVFLCKETFCVNNLFCLVIYALIHILDTNKHLNNLTYSHNISVVLN